MAEYTHVGVYGILVKNDQILLITKTRGPYAGMLDLPGGRLEEGEIEEDGLRREFVEETGIRVYGAELLRTETKTTVYRQEDREMSVNHIGTLYRITEYDDSGFDPDITLEDVGGVGFYTVGDLATRPLTPFARSAVLEITG